MDFEGLENAPLSEDDERSMSRQDETIFKINGRYFDMMRCCSKEQFESTSKLLMSMNV